MAMVQVGIKMDEKLKERIEQAAKENGLSVAAFMRLAAIKFIKTERLKGGEKEA